MELKDFLGENSYPSIVAKITDRIREAKADTEEGSQYLQEIYGKLKTSDTPMLDVREFIHNCSELDDACVNDVIVFCKDCAVNNNDLNYIINLCREEHIQKLKTLGIPDPTKTLDNDGLFDNDSETIKEYIIDGMFDNLDSNLLSTIKRQLIGTTVDVNIEDFENFDDDSDEYIMIVNTAKAFIDSAKTTDTVQGTNLLNEFNKQLRISKTPLLTIRNFIVNAKQMVKDFEDTMLNNIVEKLLSICESTNLNYLINLCREEHIESIIKTAHNVPNELLIPIEEDSEEITDNILNNRYNFRSKLFDNIKKKLGVYVEDNKNDIFTLKDFLGENSYVSIVDSIIKNIQTAKADTLAGTDLLSNVYMKLNESKTPMLEIREFITNAEQVAKDDASLKTVIDFCKKKATTGDLNYIINLCKEEHFQNLKRAGHPNPEKTIEDIEKEFNNPKSLIEQAIKKGIFNKLNSKLLNEIKTSLGVKIEDRPDEIKNLDESYQYETGGFAQYCPVGVLYEDKQNNRILALCESDILSFDKDKQEYAKLDNSVIDTINDKYRRLMEAVSVIEYKPETEKFNLSENWDFIAQITNDGKCFVGLNENNLKEIDNKNLRKLLLESVQTYRVKTGKDCKEFIREADNFVMLLENHDALVKFDNLRVIRNLNEGKYVMFDDAAIKTGINPSLLSINGEQGKTYESYMELKESINTCIDGKFTKLFESEIQAESDQLTERRRKIDSLMEEQKSINENIEKVKNLKTLAEKDSPAMDKLNEQHNMLLSKLNENIGELNFYQNEYKLH